ncbi:MAG TPA: uroporphyrinogen decarboxylase family protein [Armatimonadota bacterium]|jgi:hypothetical protein
MTPRENLLRAARFERPESIPMFYHINAACWHHYPQAALQELLAKHPLLFPDFVPQDQVEPLYAPDATAGTPFTDPWGCVWETSDNGIVGAVTGHPLATWDAFDRYTPPDADSDYDWEAIGASLTAARGEGRLCAGSLAHGHTFLRACDIHGYENIILDMADEEPRLPRLLDMIEAYNARIVARYLACGVEWMSFPEDLGMQVGPMLSPAQFRQYIKPAYARLMAPAKAAGCIVHMHSDGDIRELVDDLIDDGVTAMNLQDLVNGVDWIRTHLKGRVCIDLDIDRQSITRFGAPAEIDALIRSEVETLGSREGGLTMIFGMYPGMPLENADALMDAMERYMGHFA